MGRLLSSTAIEAIESVLTSGDEAIVKRENGKVVVIRCIRSLKYKAAADKKQEPKEING